MKPINSKKFRSRYFVPDLSPLSREPLAELGVDMIFVAESPHVDEVMPENVVERRPLCGKAGREWWKAVGLVWENNDSSATDLERMLRLCRLGRFAVLNASQFPLDPKIMLHYGDSANPVLGLGFSKVSPDSFKQRKATLEVMNAVEDLRLRLSHPLLKNARIFSLGNDASWFIERAGFKRGESRHEMTIPHPSAWWRKGGAFRKKAYEQLRGLKAESGIKTKSDLQPSHSAGRVKAPQEKASRARAL